LDFFLAGLFGAGLLALGLAAVFFLAGLAFSRALAAAGAFLAARLRAGLGSSFAAGSLATSTGSAWAWAAFGLGSAATFCAAGSTGSARFWVGHSQVSQDLPIDGNVILRQSVHEAAVVQPSPSAGGRNPGDPKLAELALLELAADDGVLAGTQQGLPGHAVPARGGADIAPGSPQNLLVLAGAGGALSCSWHHKLLKGR